MAYVTKYQLNIAANYFGQAVVCNLKKRDYAGASSYLKGSGDSPIMLTYDTASDDIFNPINGTYLTLNIMEEVSFALSELYTTDAREWRVELLVDASTVFEGFILPDIFQMPYKDTPYHISIVAADQLGYLRNVYFDQKNMYDNLLLINIIAACLAKTDLGLNLREAVNVYEDAQDSGNADSPLDQTYVDMEAYINDDGTMMDCYTILSDLLRNFQAILRQVNGEWHIWRPSEASTSYRRRLWTWGEEAQGWLYTSNALYNPVKSTTSSSGSPLIRIMDNGSLMTIPPWKQYILKRHYKKRKSILLNHNFTDWIDFNTPMNWTKSDSPTVSRHDNGVLIYADTAAPYGLLLQTAPIKVITPMSDSTWKIKVRYTIFVPGTKEADLYITILLWPTAPLDQWSWVGNVWGVSNDPIKSVDNSGNAGAYYESFDAEFVINNYSSDYGEVNLSASISLHGDDATAFAIVEYIELSITNHESQYGDAPENLEQLVTVNDNNNYIADDINLLSGELPDLLVYDRRGDTYTPVANKRLIYGSGFYNDAARDDLCEDWEDPDATGQKSLLSLLKEKIGNQYRYPTEMISCDILTSQIVGDSTIQEINNSNNLYMINRDTWNLKSGVHTIEMTQIYNIGKLLLETGDFLLTEAGDKIIL